MSKIEELAEEREKLRLEQFEHQKGIEECERRQLEIGDKQTVHCSEQGADEHAQHIGQHRVGRNMHQEIAYNQRCG